MNGPRPTSCSPTAECGSGSKSFARVRCVRAVRPRDDWKGSLWRRNRLSVSSWPVSIMSAMSSRPLTPLSPRATSISSSSSLTTARPISRLIGSDVGWTAPASRLCSSSMRRIEGYALYSINFSLDLPGSTAFSSTQMTGWSRIGSSVTSTTSRRSIRTLCWCSATQRSTTRTAARSANRSCRRRSEMNRFRTGPRCSTGS